MYFAGYSIGCVVLARFADLYGRKYIYIMALWLQLCIYFGLLFSDKFVYSLGLIFVFGICGSGRGSIGYLYLLELMPKADKVLIGTLNFATSESLFVWSALYLKYVSKNTTDLLIIGIVINFLCDIAICFIPESPDYLYAVKDYQGARDQLNYIGRFNG